MVKGHVYGTNMYFLLKQHSHYPIPNLSDAVVGIFTPDIMLDGKVVRTALVINVEDKVCDFLDRISTQLGASGAFTVEVGRVPSDKTLPVEILTGRYERHFRSSMTDAGPISGGIQFSMMSRWAIQPEEKKLREFAEMVEKNNESEEEENAE